MALTLRSKSTVEPPSTAVVKLYSVYTKGRNTPHDLFVGPLTDREWWRVTLKETPVPGTYQLRDFLEDKELNRIKPTYNFKGEGRKKLPSNTRRGDLLLPGAYQHEDYLDQLSRLPLTYQFKNAGRRRVPAGSKDKDCNVAPNVYKTDRPAVKKIPVTHGVFKSQSSRFPTKYFDPKIGPPPGSYEPKMAFYNPAISSSFKSQTPRFRTSQTKVPGPATYDPTIQAPQAQTLTKMGRMHGLFFRNSFEI